jgi:hypothetical protein
LYSTMKCNRCGRPLFICMRNVGSKDVEGRERKEASVVCGVVKKKKRSFSAEEISCLSRFASITRQPVIKNELRVHTSTNTHHITSFTPRDG